MVVLLPAIGELKGHDAITVIAAVDGERVLTVPNPLTNHKFERNQVKLYSVKLIALPSTFESRHTTGICEIFNERHNFEAYNLILTNTGYRSFVYKKEGPAINNTKVVLKNRKRTLKLVNDMENSNALHFVGAKMNKNVMDNVGIVHSFAKDPTTKNGYKVKVWTRNKYQVWDSKELYSFEFASPFDFLRSSIKSLIPKQKIATTFGPISYRGPINIPDIIYDIRAYPPLHLNIRLKHLKIDNIDDARDNLIMVINFVYKQQGNRPQFQNFQYIPLCFDSNSLSLIPHWKTKETKNQIKMKYSKNTYYSNLIKQNIPKGMSVEFKNDRTNLYNLHVKMMTPNSVLQQIEVWLKQSMTVNRITFIETTL
jgi:hypothetical protein